MGSIMLGFTEEEIGVYMTSSWRGYFLLRCSFLRETPKGVLNVFGQDMWRLDCNVADDFGSKMSPVCWSTGANNSIF